MTKIFKIGIVLLMILSNLQWTQCEDSNLLKVIKKRSPLKHTSQKRKIIHMPFKWGKRSVPETKPFADELTNLCVEFIYLVLSRNGQDFSRLLKSDLDYLTTCFEIVRDSIVYNDTGNESQHFSKTNELKLHQDTHKVNSKMNNNFKSSKKNQLPFKWG